MDPRRIATLSPALLVAREIASVSIGDGKAGRSATVRARLEAAISAFLGRVASREGCLDWWKSATHGVVV